MGESLHFMAIVEEFGQDHAMGIDFIVKNRVHAVHYELTWPCGADSQCMISISCRDPGRPHGVRLQVGSRGASGAPEDAVALNFADLLPLDDGATVRQILEDARQACELIAGWVDDGAMAPHDLVRILESENPLDRYVAISLLELHRNKEPSPGLEKHLQNRDPVVRAEVAHCFLMSCDVENRRAALALHNDPDLYVRTVIPSPPA